MKGVTSSQNQGRSTTILLVKGSSGRGSDGCLNESYSQCFLLHYSYCSFSHKAGGNISKNSVREFVRIPHCWQSGINKFLFQASACSCFFFLVRHRAKRFYPAKGGCTWDAKTIDQSFRACKLLSFSSGEQVTD